MSQTAPPSLLEIEQEIEAQAREWHRQQLQKRLQQAAEEQGADVRTRESFCKRPVMKP